MGSNTLTRESKGKIIQLQREELRDGSNSDNRNRVWAVFVNHFLWIPQRKER